MLGGEEAKSGGSGEESRELCGWSGVIIGGRSEGANAAAAAAALTCVSVSDIVLVCVGGASERVGGSDKEAVREC